MFKTYEFSVEIYDKDNNLVDERTTKWQDRSQGTAKDWLRLSIQEEVKKDRGFWPRVELICNNPDVGCYRDDS